MLGRHVMEGKEIRVELTLKLDTRSYGQLSQEDLVEYLRARLVNVLGFRGRLKQLRIVVPKSRSTSMGISAFWSIDAIHGHAGTAPRFNVWTTRRR
jgi:hypothetical protein